MGRSIFENNSDPLPEPVVTEAEQEEMEDDALLAEIDKTEKRLSALRAEFLTRKRRGASGSSG